MNHARQSSLLSWFKLHDNAAATSFTDSNRVARDWTSNQDKSHLCITPASSKLPSVIVDKKANELERRRYRIFE